MNIKILSFVLVLSLVGNIVLGIGYYKNMKNDSGMDNGVQLSEEQREKIGEFNKFFITKIIATGGQIDFEDRNKIEIDLKELNIQSITENWNNFVSSQDGESAQKTAIQMLIAISDAMAK